MFDAQAGEFVSGHGSSIVLAAAAWIAVDEAVIKAAAAATAAVFVELLLLLLLLLVEYSTLRIALIIASSSPSCNNHVSRTKKSRLERDANRKRNKSQTNKLACLSLTLFSKKKESERLDTFFKD